MALYYTKFLSPSDPRRNTFDDAKQKEIEGFIDWIRKVVCKDEIPDDANILGGKFVLATKDADTEKETREARFVVQSFRGVLKEPLVQDTSTAREQSTRILVGLASSVRLRLFSTDAT